MSANDRGGRSAVPPLRSAADPMAPVDAHRAKAATALVAVPYALR